MDLWIGTVFLLAGMVQSFLATSEAQCNNNRLYNFAMYAAYSSSEANLKASYDALTGCEAVNTFYLARHGTRYGSDADHRSILSLRTLQEGIIENIEAGRNIDLCDEDLNNILAWTTHVDDVTANALTEQGQRDHLDLARRIKTRFPFLQNLSRDQIKLTHSLTDRTQNSAKFFGKGLLEDLDVDTDGYDILCDFFGVCSKFDALYAKALADGPYKTFQGGSEMEKVLKCVGKRLGFEQSLAFDYIEAIYFSCGYETAWNISRNSIPAWCAVLSQDEFEVLEYWVDLKWNQVAGYMQEKLHSKLGCIPINAMYEYFREIVEAGGDAEEKGRFYFTHDTLLTMVYTYLGLYKDETPLSADAVILNRAWRVTRFCPFTSNIGAVLFRCNEAGKKPTFKVQLILNENPLALEGCDGDVCTWQQFSALFGCLSCDTTNACLAVDEAYATFKSIGGSAMSLS